MFYRLLGKFFLYFIVIPSIVRSWRFARPSVAAVLTKAIKDITKNEKKEAERSRRNHPAGSRLR